MTQRIGFSVGEEIFGAIANGSKTAFHIRAELVPDATKFAASFPGALSFVNRNDGQKVQVWASEVNPNFEIDNIPIGQYLGDLNDQDDHTVIELPDDSKNDAGGGVATIAPPIVGTTTITMARVPNPGEKIIRLDFLTPKASEAYLSR